MKLVKHGEINLIFVKDINEGMSPCNAFEYLFSQVLAHFNLSPDSPIKWIEFWEKSNFREKDEYSLVNYQIRNGKAVNPYWTYLGDSEQTAINAIH